MMQPRILHRQAEAEYYTDERCHIIELCNIVADAAVSIAEARVEPGVTTRWHCLRGTVERYVIVRGEGVVEVGGLPATRVQAGSVVIIPAECPQRISNTGTTDLLLLAICTPRFQQHCYEDVEASMTR